MKKLIYCATAFAMMFFAGSCQQELLDTPEGDATVTYTVELPGLATKAEIGDGSNVNQLIYEVWKTDDDGIIDEESKRLYQKDILIEDGAKWIVPLNLVQNQYYKVLFWAQVQEENGTVYYDTDELTAVTYAENLKLLSNQENYAAFYGQSEVISTFQAPKPKTVTLTRPFAQLNIGTINNVDPSEYKIKMVESSVSVSVPTSFNVATKTPGESPYAKVTFDFADVLTKPLDVDQSYQYVAMNYVFAPMDLQNTYTSDVTYTIKANVIPAGQTTGTEVLITKDIPSVPFKENFRTNIVGNLLTNSVVYDVVIDEKFNDPAFVETVEPLVVVETAEELQAVANTATESVIIKFGADLKGDVMIVEREGIAITIQGDGKKYDGTIKIHNNSSYNSGSVVIENVKFTTSKVNYDSNGKPYFYFVMLDNFTNEQRYSQNVTVKGCDFTTTNTEVDTYGVGVFAKSSNNLKVEGCIATGVHSLLQATSCGAEVSVSGCTVNGKNGVSFGNTKNATIEKTTITAEGYGVRAEGTTEREVSLTVTGCTINAYIPVVVRKLNDASVKPFTLNVNGSNNYLTKGGEYDIALGSNEYEKIIEPDKPVSEYNIDNVDAGFVVYPRDYYHPVETWEEFTDALAANEAKIKLTADISTSASYSLFNNVLLDLNGKTLEISGATNRLNIGSKNDGSKPKPTVTIKNGNINCKVYAQTGNLTLTDITFGGSIAYAGDSQGVISVGGAANLLAENCKMTNVKKSGSTKPRSICTEGRSSGYLILRDCNFKNSNLDRAYINPLNGNTTLELTNCALYSMASNIDLGASYSWTNMNLTGCSGGFTFTISRASTNLTDEEMAVYKAIKKNNSGSMRFLFTDGEKNSL